MDHSHRQFATWCCSSTHERASHNTGFWVGPRAYRRFHSTCSSHPSQSQESNTAASVHPVLSTRPF
eukprot:scaffold102_cov340-Pavlova_lutheri.AAC.51